MPQRTLSRTAATLLALCLLDLGPLSCVAGVFHLNNTVRLAPAQWPDFTDDLDFRGLSIALERELHASSSGKGVVLARRFYMTEHIRRSARRFLELTRDITHCLQQAKSNDSRTRCQNNFNHVLHTEFVVYRTKKAAELTAYYTPTIDVEVKARGEFRFPIYAVPPSDTFRQTTRQAIDFHHALDGLGLEMYYARDRFDLYVLHIEGGGRLRVHDANGQTRFQYLTYAGDNGQPLQMLDEYMLQHRMLRFDDTSRFAQRQYLSQHPQEAERVYASSPGYVFFANSPQPPMGSSSVPLTARRSLAADPVYYPEQGLITYIVFRVPELPDKDVARDANPGGLHQHELKRFFIDQDEGPHIKGRARFDLYFGESDYAYFLANNLHTHNVVYFLMLK